MSLQYKDFIEIDTGALDTEWASAASRYMEVVEAQADATESVDRLKDKLEATMATLSNSVAADPETYGLTKNTDTAVKNYVMGSDSVKAAQDELREARKQLIRVNGLLTAMDHRRRALENLVELHSRNYQAEPRLKSAVSREHLQKIESADVHDNIGQHLNRGRKS